EFILENFERNRENLREGFDFIIFDYDKEATLLRGDILCFSVGVRVINHAGIYIGGNKMIHAGDKIEIAELTNTWKRCLKKVIRLIKEV
ncbi:C40 family peptidase, partial [Candidatus Bathyarchaeota archaeon]|nr:C40 family peptidase [Candidatus Bathyarchaeota archaeon]